MRAGQRDLRALGRSTDFQHPGPDTVARIVTLAGNLLALGQDGLGLADLEDHVALLDPVDHTPEDLALLALELLVDPVTLGVAHPLQDDLLGRLRRDPPELLVG